MYSLLTTFDTAAYNIQTFNSIPGTIKIFDVVALDPINILADSAVNYEMCEIPLYIDQFKNMASLDYASISDNLTREILVIMLEMPEARGAIGSLKEAAECGKKYAEENDIEAEDASGATEDFDDWSSFAADGESTSIDECLGLVDKYTVGQIAGRLTVRLFNTELQPNV